MASRQGMPSFLVPGRCAVGLVLMMLVMLGGCGRQTGEKPRDTEQVAPGFEALDEAESPVEWLTYQGKGWSLRFPSLFSLDTTGYLGSSLILFSTLTDDGDQYADNISVSVVNLAGLAADLDGYVTRCVQHIHQYTEDPEIMLSDRRRTNGQVYHKLVYSEQQPTFRLIRVQHLMVNAGKVYVVTLTCEDAVYDLCKEVGEIILESFRLT